MRFRLTAIRERDSPQVKKHVRNENEYALAQLAVTRPLQQEIFLELQSRCASQPGVKCSERVRHKYFSAQKPGKAAPAYYRQSRESPHAPPEVIFDPNQATGNVNFGVLDVSPDEATLVYSVDPTGEEKYELHFVDLRTGKEYPEIIANTVEFAWGNDSRTAYYCIMDDKTRPHQVMRHVLGTAPDGIADTIVFHEPSDEMHLSLQKSADQSLLFIKSTSYTSAEIHFIDMADAHQTPTPIIMRKPGIEYTAEHYRHHFYVLTNDSAPEFRLIRTPVTHPNDPTQWEDIVPASNTVTLQEMVLSGNHLVLLATEQGIPELRIYNLSSSRPELLDTVQFDEAAYSILLCTDSQAELLFQPVQAQDHFYFTYSSLVTPNIMYRYNFATRSKEIVRRDTVLNYDPEDYTLTRLHGTSADGTTVPLTVAHRKGIALNGENPLLLFGYGAYGTTEDLFFQPRLVSLLERGVAYAIGKLLQKRKGPEDLLACIDALQATGYTSALRLGLYGRSAGGVLVGAALNLCPSKLGLCITEVPFLDCIGVLMDDELPLTASDREEFGHPGISPEVLQYMLTYSPYHTVAAQEYPHVLLIGGLHDPRVQYWEPLKWAAKLRSKKTDSRPLLCRILPGGHYGSPGEDGLRETAEKYAWILYVLGGRSTGASV